MATSKPASPTAAKATSRTKSKSTSKQPASSPPLHFAGPPDAVEGLVPIDPQRRREIAVSIYTDDGWAPVRALTAPAGQHTLVRLILPAGTPACQLDASVAVGEETFAAVVEATAQAELDCTPGALEVEVEDLRASASVTVVNVGNVAVDIPDIAAFGLMQEGGLETAIGSALMTKDTGVDRLGRAVDALSERHGGLARLSIESGGGRLEPGAATAVRARIHVGDGLAPGRRYHGVWPLATLRIPVSFRVPQPSTPVARSRRPAKKGTSK